MEAQHCNSDNSKLQKKKAQMPMSVSSVTISGNPGPLDHHTIIGIAMTTAMTDDDMLMD